MHPDYEKYDYLRERLEKEVNQSVIQPVSFEIYKKTPDEKIITREEKSKWKQAMIFSYGKNCRKYNNPII